MSLPNLSSLRLRETRAPAKTDALFYFEELRDYEGGGGLRDRNGKEVPKPVWTLTDLDEDQESNPNLPRYHDSSYEGDDHKVKGDIFDNVFRDGKEVIILGSRNVFDPRYLRRWLIDKRPLDPINRGYKLTETELDEMDLVLNSAGIVVAKPVLGSVPCDRDSTVRVSFVWNRSQGQEPELVRFYDPMWTPEIARIIPQGPEFHPFITRCQILITATNARQKQLAERAADSIIGKMLDEMYMAIRLAEPNHPFYDSSFALRWTRFEIRNVGEPELVPIDGAFFSDSSSEIGSAPTDGNMVSIPFEMMWKLDPNENVPDSDYMRGTFMLEKMAGSLIDYLSTELQVYTLKNLGIVHNEEQSAFKVFELCQ